VRGVYAWIRERQRWLGWEARGADPGQDHQERGRGYAEYLEGNQAPALGDYCLKEDEGVEAPSRWTQEAEE
jgi:hypothetical protein